MLQFIISLSLLLLITSSTHAMEKMLSQNELNERLEIAINNYNLEAENKWRQQGALHPHEEIYNCFTNKQPIIAEYLLHYYCYKGYLGQRHLYGAFAHGIRQDNKDFITFILEKTSISPKSDYVQQSISFAKAMDRSEIVQCLEEYKAEKKAIQ